MSFILPRKIKRVTGGRKSEATAKSEVCAAYHEIIIIIIIIIMMIMLIIMVSSLMCYFSKLEHIAHYKAKNKIHSKQTFASTRTERERERETPPHPIPVHR